MDLRKSSNFRSIEYLTRVQVEELLTNLTKFVHENEQSTLRYHLHKEINKDTPEFVMIET